MLIQSADPNVVLFVLHVLPCIPSSHGASFLLPHCLAASADLPADQLQVTVLYGQVGWSNNGTTETWWLHTIAGTNFLLQHQPFWATPVNGMIRVAPGSLVSLPCGLLHNDTALVGPGSSSIANFTTACLTIGNATEQRAALKLSLAAPPIVKVLVILTSAPACGRPPAFNASEVNDMYFKDGGLRSLLVGCSFGLTDYDMAGFSVISVEVPCQVSTSYVCLSLSLHTKCRLFFA